jgi:putative addiction module component (TIGR02574 family)
LRLGLATEPDYVDPYAAADGGTRSQCLARRFVPVRIEAENKAVPPRLKSRETGRRALARRDRNGEIVSMASRLPGFGHLTPEERIELAERLWDSLPIESIKPDDMQVAELRRRRSELAADSDPGTPWRSALGTFGGPR